MGYDRRDYMAYRNALNEDVFTVTVYNEKDEETIVEFPTKFEVCGTCNGKGTHVNPSIDANGITQSEMYELGPEFEDEYFSGAYDVTCNECHGKRVVSVPDLDRLTPEQKEAWEYHLESEQERYDDYVIMQHECGIW